MVSSFTPHLLGELVRKTKDAYLVYLANKCSIASRIDCFSGIIFLFDFSMVCSLFSEGLGVMPIGFFVLMLRIRWIFRIY